MILADISIWADHLHRSESRLIDLIEAGELLMHPFVLGEIALGYLRKRTAVLGALHDLASSHIAEPEEVIALIEHKQLVASGIGYVDVHLLAAVLTTRECQLWTRDRRLGLVAAKLGIAAEPVS
jgi:hypothetical protein